jgi:hypothetical protein
MTEKCTMASILIRDTFLDDCIYNLHPGIFMLFLLIIIVLVGIFFSMLALLLEGRKK